MTIGVVLAGGASTHQHVPGWLHDPSVACLVVAADSGLDLAQRLGVDVDLLVGDLDSVSASALGRARRDGVEILEYPSDKDATDLELALGIAIEELGRDHGSVGESNRIVVLGGAGGRLDHLLGNVALLASMSTLHGVAIEAYLGGAYVAVVDSALQPRWSATVRSGAMLSVMAWSPEAVVSESGVRWTLRSHRLRAGSTLGISNEALGGEVVVSVDEGVTLVVIPDAEVLS